MTDPIIIHLPGEPVGKGRPRFANGTVFTPEKTRAYEGALRHAARLEMRGAKPLSGPLNVVVVAGFSIPQSFSKAKRADALSRKLRPTKKPDADNILKCCDALNGIVFDDDAQIVQGTICKIYADEPSLTISVAPLLLEAEYA